MGTITCPYCKRSLDSSSTFCPYCHRSLKKGLMKYVFISCVIIVLAGIAAFLFLPHSGQPGGIPATVPTTQPPASITQPASAMPAEPPCTIAITGSKVPPSTVRLQVMTSTCYAGDIAELSVSINGEKKGTLGTGPGATGTFPGTSAANTVIVVAKYSNGGETVVYQNSAL